MAKVAGVDVGATNIRAAIADGSGTIIEDITLPTPQTTVGVDVTDRTLEALRTVAAAAGIDPTAIAAVGIGSIGPLDLTEGVIEEPANLPMGIDRVPLVGPIQHLIDDDRVFLRNDATAGVVGEHFYGEYAPDNMVYLTISTGIGAGVIVDGSLLEGWDGNAGEIGHMVVDPNGTRTCGCGKKGHWEAYASGENIPEYARDLASQFHLDTELPVDDASFSAADVFDAPDDPLARVVIDRVNRWNRIGVANIIHAYAPLVVVIGGPVALENPDTVIDPLIATVPDQVMINVPEIRPTEFGDDVVLRGAIALALENTSVVENT